MDQPRYVEPASTQYDEFVGTCAFDEPQSQSLAELFGVPHDDYFVLGFHIGAGGYGDNDLDFAAVVYAVELAELNTFGTLNEMAVANHGDIPVVEIEVHTTGGQVLRAMKQSSITALSHGIHQSGHRLRIVKERSFPEEADDG